MDRFELVSSEPLLPRYVLGHNDPENSVAVKFLAFYLGYQRYRAHRLKTNRSAQETLLLGQKSRFDADAFVMDCGSG